MPQREYLPGLACDAGFPQPRCFVRQCIPEGIEFSDGHPGGDFLRAGLLLGSTGAILSEDHQGAAAYRRAKGIPQALGNLRQGCIGQ
jgi:hypothetical protein